MNKNKLYNEVDMMIGNVNRMCLTDKLKELTDMYEWAERRLQTIHKMCLERFEE